MMNLARFIAVIVVSVFLLPIIVYEVTRWGMKGYYDAKSDSEKQRE